jgi:hypothetical protein
LGQHHKQELRQCEASIASLFVPQLNQWYKPTKGLNEQAAFALDGLTEGFSAATVAAD